MDMKNMANVEHQIAMTKKKLKSCQELFVDVSTKLDKVSFTGLQQKIKAEASNVISAEEMEPFENKSFDECLLDDGFNKIMKNNLGKLSERIGPVTEVNDFLGAVNDLQRGIDSLQDATKSFESLSINVNESIGKYNENILNIRNQLKEIKSHESKL